MAAALNRVDSVEDAVGHCVETIGTVFNDSIVAFYEYDSSTTEARLIDSTSPNSLETVHEPPSADVLRTVHDSRAIRRNDATEETATDLRGPLQNELLARVGQLGVISLGSTEPDRFDSDAIDVLDKIAETLGAVIERIKHSDDDISGYRQSTHSERQRPSQNAEPTADVDVTALRRLHELMLNSTDFDETVDRILSVGCEQFDLETGILSRISGTDYHIESVVDTTGSYEQEAEFDLNETMCEVTVEQGATEPLAFADSADTDHLMHPAADKIRAYIGVPVVVGGNIYGTLNFSSETPRKEAIGPGEREFIKLMSQWLGTQIERDQQRSELERYETIIETVDDPVYALDTDGQFTFINEAAKREFGYGQEILGDHVSVVMDSEDLERIRDQRKALAETNERSITAQFDLKTSDRGRKIVETRHAVIGDREFQGTAGMIRDVTEREARRRRLESFRQAIEEAADGVAILEDGEYVYVDQTHADMYGFDSPNQLLGASWQKLYDDEEVARLESEAFPKLEADGYWRGTAIGSRPDGTTFPTELSLTIVDDGRLVCTVRDETERTARKRELELKERAMDETNVSIQITDPTQDDNPLVYVNDGFEQITGYTREEALGRNPRFLQGPESDPEKIERLRTAVDAEEPVTMEVVNYRPDGTPYWAKLSVTPVYDDDGTLQNFIGIQQDVTDRRRLSETLEDRTERLELVLSGTGTGIGELDLRTDDVIWDETLKETFGRNPETIGEWREFVHPEDRDRVQAELEKAVETGEPWSDAFRVITGSGDHAWLETRTIPVYEDGEPVKVLATGTDVTERKQREQALAESRERYETLLQAAPDPVFVADDVTGEIVETNEAAAALRGEPREEIIGRHQTELHPSNKTEAHKAAFTRALECDGVITELSDGTQPKLCTVDDETVPVEITADTVDLPDGPVIYSVFRDVSERVENERELELKERAMDEANVGITISDPYTPDNPIVYVNQGFVNQTGYSREAALGRNRRFLQDDDRDQPALNTLREAVIDEEPVTVDLRNYRWNGELFWNRLSVTPVYDEAGTLANYIGIQQDVTEEKLREQRLRALHETTRELLQTEAVDDAATVAADALFEELDVDLAGIYLRDGDELVQNTVLGAVPEQVPERIERGRTPLWEAIESGNTVVYDEFTDLDDGINRAEMAGTAYFPLHDHGAVVVGALDQRSLTEADRKLIEVLVGNLVAVLDTLNRQRQLRDEREQFRLLTQSIDEYAFVIVDETGRIETWDQSARNIFGYDTEAAIGMSIGKLHPVVDRESGLPDRLIQQARIAGESAHEGWQVRADGSEFYADTHVAPLETDNGEVEGYAVIVRDMTDRRQRERRTELFVEKSDDVVCVLDSDGTMSYVSGSSRRVLGYDPDDLLEENFFDYVHPRDRESVMEEFFSSIDDPDSEVRSECRFESADGEWLNIDGRCQNMMTEDAVGGMLLYLRDVTGDRRRARRLEAVFNGTFQFSGMLEPDGTIIDVNDAVVDFVSYDPEEIVDRPLSEAPWWTQAQGANDRVRDAVTRAANGELVRFEIDVHGNDGIAHVDFSVKPVTDADGEVALLIAEGRDITAFQQQRQHLEVIQRVMRHNMRNDLTKLRGWMEILSMEDDAQKRATHYERVQRILDKWEKMSGDLKRIERALRSQQRTEAVTDLLPLVSRLVSSQRDAHPDATIDVNASNVEPVRIPATIREALQELVDNAIRATDHPDPHVVVRLSRPDDDWVEIDVVDNGPGMPEMEAEVLETGEETPLNHGQGLGVWMVRMLVTQVGGDVSVDVTDYGTCVSLQIPCHHASGTGS